LKKFIQFIISIIAFAFILSGAVWLTLNFKPLYKWDAEKYNLTKECGMGTDELLANYDALIEYNNFWGPDTLKFPSLPMSAEGEQHFAEVKQIFVILEWTAMIGFVVMLIGLIALKSRRALRLTGVLSIIFPIVAAGAFYFFWDKMFVLFHKLFFANDFWIFNAASDPVILILPEEFFLHCVLMIAGIMIVAGIICIILSRPKYRLIKHTPGIN